MVTLSPKYWRHAEFGNIVTSSLLHCRSGLVCATFAAYAQGHVEIVGAI